MTFLLVQRAQDDKKSKLDDVHVSVENTKDKI